MEVKNMTYIVDSHPDFVEGFCYSCSSYSAPEPGCGSLTSCGTYGCGKDTI